MKNLCIIFITSVFLSSCSKYPPVSPAAASISLLVNKNIFVSNGTDKLIFTVKDNNGNDITSSCIFFNGTQQLDAASFTSSTSGNFTFSAKYNDVVSNNVYASAVQKQPTYTRKVFAEDITGTWCGNCPLLSYNLDSISRTNANLFFAAIHDESTDPYKTNFASTIENSIPDFNNAFPTGFVNRSVKATQFSIVDIAAQSFAEPAGAGLAIATSFSGNDLSVNVTAGFETDLSSSNIKLAIMLVEDSLTYAQTTYYYHSYLIPSSNPLYNEQSPIINYKHNEVLRSYATDPLGDAIPSSYTTAGNVSYQKTVTFDLSNYNAANCNVIALLIQNNGSSNVVLNAQKVKAGSTQKFN